MINEKIIIMQKMGGNYEAFIIEESELVDYLDSSILGNGDLIVYPDRVKIIREKTVKKKLILESTEI